MATANVIAWAEQRSVNLISLVRRHLRCDWGDLTADDKKLNDDAATSGVDRIFSAYVVEGQKIYVVTEHDRSVTTVMLAEDY